MSDYVPQTWVILHVTVEGIPETYKVLGGVSGGYLDGDSWRMNSGITHVEVDEDCFRFYGASGSCYKCYKHGYGLMMSNGPIYDRLKKEFGDAVMIMDEDTDWTEISY